ncbi:pancreas/duodenum homeobox protein 1 [Pseudodesulfovibrio sp. zrk46]|uniref:pancreas/duodenum homeobox protein 1 n=1 Tax=Pseudodesulfovibrio sp. zrk46 TaxID=2725288 RepID=UPI0014495799|nr:pancreas/duodenum homeobox protein 1 [Pseudodesulfovibrio sp. zrk46]QJB57165.1 pancreas/duodenum homeobox protein 1 [Pseudodesulfovibrio sp. zrk46]
MDYEAIFTQEKLEALFPAERTNDFFEALFGDAEEGAYDIALGYAGNRGDKLNFELRLTQRPGKCLACNLTYGLPQVFARHPIINVQGIADAAAEAAGKGGASWKLGATQEMSNQLHVIPFMVELG